MEGGVSVRSAGVTGVRDTRPLVAHVITRLIRGGAQLTVHGLAAALSERFRVHVICGPDEGPEGSIRDEVAAVAPVTVIRTLRRDIHPLQDLTAVISLRRELRRLRPAIVHSHSSKAGIATRFAAHGLPCAAVHTIHGWGHTPEDPRWRRRLFVQLERAAAFRSDALVAVSVDVRNEGIALGIGKPSQYHVIPEFVDYTPRDPDFFAARTRARETLELPADGAVVGWVGRFVPQKDPDALAASLREIVERRPKTCVVLIGDGPLRPQVESALSSLRESGHVRFAGLRKDARDLYAAFDVLIHPSRWEGQPRVIQEAIAERVPVVATRVSGTTELVLPYVTGHLVEPGDAAALATRTVEILDDPAARAPLPPPAIERVASANSEEASLAGHLSLYERLMGGRSPSPQ